jgi:hypothetical protein
MVFALLTVFAIMLATSLSVLSLTAQVTQAVGAVEVRKAGGTTWAPLVSNDRVKAGDMVRTQKDGRAVLTWLGGTRLVLDSGAEVVVRACQRDKRRNSTTAVFELTTGQVWLRVRNMELQQPGSRFEVRTKDLVATVKGTTFRVTADAAGSRVSVREGHVDVQDLGGTQRLAVTPGQVAEMAPPKAPTSGPMPAEDMLTWAAQTEVLEPYLEWTYPSVAQSATSEGDLVVKGTTDPGCTVTVNKQPVLVQANGEFSATVTLRPGENQIVAVTTAPDGLTSRKTRPMMYRPH